jgi:hypothetical protein
MPESHSRSTTATSVSPRALVAPGTACTCAIGKQLADGRRVDARQLEAREEHALGRQQHLHVARARHRGKRRALLAQHLATTVEEDPVQRPGRRSRGREEDAQAHQ